jgi:hypothetical protein
MANKIYIARETAITFKGSGGDYAITLNNLAAGVARISARADQGVGSKAREFEVRAVMEFETAPVVGNTVDLYLSTSDGIDPDGQEGVADADVGDNESLKNMKFIGSVVVTSTDADHQMTASFIIPIPTRYYSIVVHNKTADNLQATANTCWVIVTPIPPEVQ